MKKRGLVQLDSLVKPGAREKRGFRAGFTLLEVIVAGSVLFIVASAVVGLSNTIIQGTVSNSDATITNRWSSEGLELVQKVRDENVLNKQLDSNGNFIWLDQATSVDKYGWYKLTTSITDPNKWELSLVDGNPELPFTSFENIGEKMTADQTTAYRLICIEAVGAQQSGKDDGNVYCNAAFNSNGDYSGPYKDGGTTGSSRTLKSDCATEDLYCVYTKASLNATGTSRNNFIPDGNAVKVRSVVAWVDKANYKTSDISTLFTNWKGYGLDD